MHFKAGKDGEDGEDDGQDWGACGPRRTLREHGEVRICYQNDTSTADTIHA